MFNDKNLLITGGTGSFGKKCAAVLMGEFTPRRLVIYSRDEQKHVDMARNLFPEKDYPQIRYFIGDVRDASRLRRALRGIDYVIHAAAMKHVDVAEYNPQECIHTNVGGAENLIDACIDCGVKQLVALSTDKAACPVNLYGATKLCSDKLFVAGNALSGGSGTRFSVVRYGNVLGSNGSVIPLFLREQSTGVLPITDLRMTRFIITLDQGVRFVLRAFQDMQGGEIFVPKIPSAKITDIAKAVGPHCSIKVIGIRPGEKLHECMIPEDESRQTEEFDDRFVIRSACRESRQRPRTDGLDAQPCPENFCYSSDNNTHWLSVAELRRMIDTFCGDGSKLDKPPGRLAA